MENAFLSTTESPETYKKGFGFNYTKMLNMYIAKNNYSNSYHRRLIYTNNFYKSQGKTKNRTEIWVNKMNICFREKHSCYTHEMVLKLFLQRNKTIMS